jgi:hypothetical protein
MSTSDQAIAPAARAPAGGPLQVDSDDAFTKREFAAESVGWVMLSLVLVAALLGALGSGPLSSAQGVSASGGLSLDYQRITHQDADDHVVVGIRDGASGTGTGTVTIRFGGQWIEGLELRQVTPQASEETGTPEGLDLSIPVRGGGPVRVVVSFRTRALGLTRGLLRVGGQEIRFTQLVLP